jgi:thiol:disulfide interchange protein DsbC
MTRYIRTALAAAFAIFLTFATLSPAEAFQGAGCGANCTDCHTLTRDEAVKLLKTDKFKAEVKEIRPAPVKGLWEVKIEQNGKIFVVFIDFGKNYLVEVNRFTELAKLGESPPLNKVDLKKIPLDGALLVGNPDAEHKLIVFDDPECQYCVKLHKEIKKIVKDRKDVAFYIKLYPLPMHPGAYDKSRTIVCKKDVLLLEDAFEGKSLPKPDCDSKEVDNNITLAQELGIRGTPAIVFPDGRLLPGYVPAEALLNLLDNPQ